MSFFKKSNVIAVLFMLIVLTHSMTLIAQQEAGEVPFLYPDPRTVGIQPYIMHGKPAGAVTHDRYAGISEQERMQRMLWNQYAEQEGLPTFEQPPCPLCEDAWKTPCGKCKMCLAGFPCEKTLCRHCVQPRSKNMSNSCDLTAGDEPCGTCDSCREHRSDPCEHADTEYGIRGEFNPYHENRLLSVLPRPLLDVYNNNARKFPVYYNPAPYYRPTWNPSTFLGYARPFTFRWSCPLCSNDPCLCDKPGMAGQVPYAYACKFCNRNPCACVTEICDVNKLMDPVGTAKALADMKEEAEGGAKPVEIRETSSSSTSSGTSSSEPLPNDGAGVGDLFDDELPIFEPDQSPPPTRRPSLDAPAPGIHPTSGSTTVSRKIEQPKYPVPKF